MCSAKQLKKKIVTVVLQNYAKISFKRLYKNLFLLIFWGISSQHFSKRPYPNVKIILTYFYIIKTI